MTPHLKIYLDYFDLTEDEVMCEACGRKANQIHHINGRLGDKNNIKNLMALCRKCHDRAHGSKDYVSKEQFQLIHNYFLQGTRKAFLK
jgi:5-methylcytosine-specific restriction endonuclease McrA